MILPLGVWLLSGVDSEPLFNSKLGQRKLAVQISQTLHWAACLDVCRAAGTATVLELGA